MNAERLFDFHRAALTAFKFLCFASFLSCGFSWGKIGETQQEMIFRLGEPESRTEIFCDFDLGDFSLSAHFDNGICVEEDYNITRIKGHKRERIRRIELLLRDASGGKDWDIVNIENGEVEWETKDGTLSAVLSSEEVTGGSRDYPESWVAEYLTVTSVAFQVEEDKRHQKLLEAERRDFPYPLLRILALGISGWLAFVFWRAKRHMLSVVLWVFVIAANPFVPLPKVPILFGGILIVGCVAFGGVAALGFWLVKRDSSSTTEK